MIDNHVYTKSELNELIKVIPKVHYVGYDDDDDIEKFAQLKIDDKFIPYIISSFGRIFSINYAGKYHNIKRMKTNVYSGYESITISYSEECYALNIHRLVALEFIYNDDPDLKVEVNHKDGDKSNNTVNNLEWVTPSENTIHAFKTGLKQPRRKYSEDSIHKVCKLLVNNYPIEDIVKKTKVSSDVIKDVILHKSWLTISSNYDFSKYHYGISDEEYQRHISNIYKACILIEENRPIKYIKAETGLSNNQLYRLLNKRTYLDISNNYDFSKYNYGLPYDYMERLEKACKYAEEGKYTITEISKMVDIPRRRIQRLISGECFKSISKKYNLSKYHRS